MLKLGQTVLGRFRVDGLGRDQALACDDDGTRYILTTIVKDTCSLGELATLLALPYPGIAPLVTLESLDDWNYVLVEREPPGQRSDRLAPMTPMQVAAAMTGLAWVLLGIHTQTRAPLAAIDPAYVWIDGERVTVMPRAQLLFLANPSSCAGRVAPFSPAFFSPEQVTGQELGIASDVHNLGSLAAYWLTGEFAYLGKSHMEVMTAIWQGRRRPIRRRHPLWQLIDELLTADPAGRPSLDEMLERLDAINLAMPPAREPDPATRAELLAAIVAAPDDDTPRLIYADFLSDYGDPRGELIQIQCAIARNDTADLRRREADLLAVHERDFTHHLYFCGAKAWTWRRGFVDSIEIEHFGSFARHLATVRGEGPLPTVVATKSSYSADRRHVLELNDPQVEVWDAATGEPVPLPHHVARRARFSDDGRVLILELRDGSTERISLPDL